MNFRAWKSIARGVVLEAIRRKDLWVIAILGCLILVCASALGFFGMNGLESFIKDLAVTILSLFSSIVAILSSTRLMPEEIKNRTLYPLLARPISRFDLLMGKLIGAVLVTWTGFFALCALTSLALIMFHVHFDLLMLQFVIAKLMGLVVICSVSLALSTYCSPTAASTLAVVLVFGSGIVVRAMVMAYSTAGAGTQVMFTAINAVLPQFGLFDLGARVANLHWGPVPAWVLGTLFAYMVFYSAAMLALGWLKFRKQAV